MLSSVPCVSADTIKVFILAGQSNMVSYAPTTGLPSNLAQTQSDVIIYANGQWLNLCPGFGLDTGCFGPELNFGRTMADSTPGTGVKVALIKFAICATNLYNQWRSPSSGGTTGDMYAAMVYTIQAALAALPAQYTPDIAGMLWLQGESDGTNTFWANTYETNLTNLIADVRKEVNKPDLPFITGMIHLSFGWMFADVIRNAATNVANKDSTVGVFDTQDLPLGGDSAHYQTAAMVEIGKRFALIMLQVINKTANKPPLVEAGARQYTVSTNYPAVFTLNGSATDDGKPNGALSILWEKVSGPGTVTFGDLNNPITMVTLSQEGTYHLRLSASDGKITSMDAAIITVDTVLNLAMNASSCTTSYCSPKEFLAAINDGVDPASSNDYSWGAYGNYPQTGTQWVQYNWSTPINADKIDVYWFDDNGGYIDSAVGVPASCVLKYWDGMSFVPVTGASSYGVAANQYNTTTFDQVTTTSLRIEFTSSGDSSTGILEWKVYGSLTGGVRQSTVAPSDNFIVSFARNILFLSLPSRGGENSVILRFFDASGRVIKQLQKENSRNGKYSIGLDILEASRIYLAEVRYGREVKIAALCKMR